MATFRWSKTKLSRAIWVNVFGLPKIDKYVARRSSKKKDVVKKKSEYWTQLKEKQIARYMFWLSESQMRKYYSKAVRSKNVTSQELIRQIEIRADNVVFRSWFATSRAQARQLVVHWHFELNWQRINTPSIQVKAWDTLKLTKKSASLPAFWSLWKPEKTIQWLKPDNKKKEIVIESLPEWDDLEQSIKVHLIVEFYSRK